MTGLTKAMALQGLDGQVVEVQAHVSTGLPQFHIVGTVDAAVREARSRVIAATAGIGIDLSQRKLTVNLTPAGWPKRGSSFDLAIAVAALAAVNHIDPAAPTDVLHIGELGLDARLRPVPGVLPLVHAAARAGLRRVLVPTANAAEARLVPGVEVAAAAGLAEVVRGYGGIVRDQEDPEPVAAEPVPAPATIPDIDLADVAGQWEARRALEIAAAGGHHLFLLGPPGAGKTMLASRLPGLLPDLAENEAVEVSAVHSLTGAFDASSGLTRRPPYEAPHHSATMVAIVGGGSGLARPGAMSRAHHGVLFLDEAPEFNVNVLEALRQPLEEGTVRIARAFGTVVYPARFQLVLAANPCPCGHFIGKGDRCSCTPMQRRQYLARLSGPVLDRIDLRVDVPAVTLTLAGAGAGAGAGEPTAAVAARVRQARLAQRARAAESGVSVNAHLSGPRLRERWRPDAKVTASIDRALDRGWLSLRGYDRVLRVAWTIADLRGASAPGAADVTDALTLREPGVAA